MVAGCTAGGSKSDKGGHATSAPAVAVPTTVGPRRGGSLVYAASQEPSGFNVNTKEAHTAAGLAVMSEVWPSVFHVAPDLSMVLDSNFMTSATLTSDSPQTLVLKINPQASWSDGVPITADDFIYFWQQQRAPLHTLDHCNDPKCTTNGTPIDDYSDGNGYRDIKSVTGTDDGKTVTVVFSQPYGDWKSLWSSIVPAHLAQKFGWNHGFDSGDPNVVISGGPFKLYSYNKGVDLTLAPNDKYWGPPPNLDSIVFRLVPDPVQQVAALQAKQADMIYQTPSVDVVNAVKAIPSVRSETGLGTQLDQLDFNVNTPGLNDVVVREAIATAIDRPSLSQATVGQFVSKAPLPNNRIFFTNQPAYRDSSGGLYDHGDVAKARQMLEADGYQLGADGVYSKSGMRLSFRITAAGQDIFGPQTAALLQTQLKPAGVEVKIDTGTPPVALGTPELGQNFDLAIVSPAISPFPSNNLSLYAQLGSAASTAGNALLDQYLTYGASAVDADRQALFLNLADGLMWQNMWTLPLYREPTFLAVRKTFVNVHDNVTPESPFWNAHTWGLLPSSAGG